MPDLPFGLLSVIVPHTQLSSSGAPVPPTSLLLARASTSQGVCRTYILVRLQETTAKSSLTAGEISFPVSL